MSRSHLSLLLALAAALLSAIAVQPLAQAQIAKGAGLTDEKKAAPAVSAKFLHSTEGTYGWAPVKGELSYDFFPDGRLHIQGKDGEATMWEGKWTLKGDQLTLNNTDTKSKKTVTVAISGKDLLIDGKLFRRYKP